MAGQNTAYDFSRFEAHEKQTKPEIKVVSRTGPVRAIYGVRPITLLMVMTIVVSIIAVLLYSNAVITEVSAEITAKTAELEILQTEHARLNRELDAKISNEAVSQIATNQLGLNKLENYQVEYINLNSQDVIITKNREKDGIFENIGQVIAKIQEYLKF